METHTPPDDEWVKPGQKVYRRDGRLIGRPDPGGDGGTADSGSSPDGGESRAD